MKTISITQMDDGTFAVESEQEAAPEAEGSPSDMIEDTAEGEVQQAQSLDEAIDLVRHAFGGEAVEQKPMMEGEGEFLAGFNGARGVTQGV